MAAEYVMACDKAEAAIREGLSLAPNDADRELWEAMLDRYALLSPNIGTRKKTPARIRTLLKRAGLSQLAAARALGVNPRTMRRYVLGETVIQDEHLGRLERLAAEGRGDA